MRKNLITTMLLALPLLAACPSGPSTPSGTPSAPASSGPAGPTTTASTPPGAPGGATITEGTQVSAAATVTAENFAFSPTEVKIKVGQSVAWVNKQGTNKLRILSDDGVINSGEFEPGKTFSQTFNKAGTYTYKNDNITSMRGTVVVE